MRLGVHRHCNGRPRFIGQVAASVAQRYPGTRPERQRVTSRTQVDAAAFGHGRPGERDQVIIAGAGGDGDRLFRLHVVTRGVLVDRQIGLRGRGDGVGQHVFQHDAGTGGIHAAGVTHGDGLGKVADGTCRKAFHDVAGRISVASIAIINGDRGDEVVECRPQQIGVEDVPLRKHRFSDAGIDTVGEEVDHCLLVDTVDRGLPLLERFSPIFGDENAAEEVVFEPHNATIGQFNISQDPDEPGFFFADRAIICASKRGDCRGEAHATRVDRVIKPVSQRQLQIGEATVFPAHGCAHVDVGATGDRDVEIAFASDGEIHGGVGGVIGQVGINHHIGDAVVGVLRRQDEAGDGLVTLVDAYAAFDQIDDARDGEFALGLAGECAPVTVDAQRVLEVRDNGIGFEPHALLFADRVGRGLVANREREHIACFKIIQQGTHIEFGAGDRQILQLGGFEARVFHLQGESNAGLADQGDLRPHRATFFHAEIQRDR